MLAVGGGEVVVRAQRGDGSYRHGLLSYVQVAKAADFPQAVGFPRLFLEAADEQHLAQVPVICRRGIR